MSQPSSHTEAAGSTAEREAVRPVAAPVLSVRDLKTGFRTPKGWVEIVKGISFDIGREETLAVVGESGSGKSVTALSIMRLLDPEMSRIEGSVRLEGRELLTLSGAEMRQVRGRQMGMIFQEAMTSLNPLQTIGSQIAEVLSIHGLKSGQAAYKEAERMLDRVRIPAAASRIKEYPHQILRRHAPARDDRHGAGLQAQAADRRRADHRARRHHPGPDPRADQGAAGRAGHVGAVHHPRHGRRGRDRRPHHRHVRRAMRSRRTPRKPMFAHAKNPYTRALLAAVPRLGR
jgi:ABC-type uncharacterized transport system YnjBCD ATPase subunit